MNRLLNMYSLICKRKPFFFAAFIISFVIAKAWGYTAVDKGYLILALIGASFWGISLIGTKYSRREIAIVSAILVISGLSLVFSHKLGAILPGMALTASKDINIDKTVRMMTKIWIPVMALRVLCAIVGIVPLGIDIKDSYINDGETVFCMGYCTANCFYTVLVIAVLLFTYSYWDKMKYWWGLVILPVAAIAFLPSKSLTGFLLLIICSLFLLIYNWIVRIKDNIDVDKIINTVLLIGAVAPVVLTFVFLRVYGINEQINTVLRTITTNRAWVNYEMAKVYDATLFGQRFDGRCFYEMVDNAYFYTLLGLGLCMFMLLSILYGICIWRCYKAGNTRRLFILCIFFIYGFMEQFFINPFMNFSMLFICDIIWNNSESKMSDEVLND